MICKDRRFSCCTVLLKYVEVNNVFNIIRARDSNLLRGTPWCMLVYARVYVCVCAWVYVSIYVKEFRKIYSHLRLGKVQAYKFAKILVEAHILLQYWVQTTLATPKFCHLTSLPRWGFFFHSYELVPALPLAEAFAM